MKKFIKWSLGFGLTYSVFIGGIFLGTNSYQNHNVHYKTESEEVASKIDGIMSYTRVTVHNDGERDVKLFRMMDSSFTYSDEDRDDLVDDIVELSTGRGGHVAMFNREEHYDKYPEKFERADEVFVREMTRFESLLSE